MQEIQDERYYISDEAICDAFFLILKEKELDKITVSDSGSCNSHRGQNHS